MAPDVDESSSNAVATMTSTADSESIRTLDSGV
jgi:hypothetical protein